MHKEFSIPQTELEPLANNLADIFIQRRDLYARQMDDGSYLCICKPLADRCIIRHLQGDLTLGTYVLDDHSRAQYLVAHQKSFDG